MSVTNTMSRLVFGREISARTPSIIPWVSPVVIGRIFLAAIFVFAGIGKFLDWSGTLGYMESQNTLGAVPALVPALLVVAALVEILGGLSIVSGTLARVGATVLILFLIPTTLLFHDFWNLAGIERQMQMSNFLKNLSIMGGLLLIVGFGAGPASLDSKIKHDTRPM